MSDHPDFIPNCPEARDYVDFRRVAERLRELDDARVMLRRIEHALRARPDAGLPIAALDDVFDSAYHEARLPVLKLTIRDWWERHPEVPRP